MNRLHLLLLLACCLLAGCASYGRQGPPPLEKGAPVVLIHPLTDSYRQATVGVLPFQMPPGVNGEEGLRVAALFKDMLLGKRIFPVVRQLTGEYGDLDEAVALGRKAGVGLVLAGQVGSLLAGTEIGGARASVSVRLLDTASGQTVWYVEQAMSQEMDLPDLSLGARLGSVMSVQPLRQVAAAPPATNMLARMAEDLADVLQGARSVSR
ncbi:MAG: hypothetical protein M0017_05015 [Desulfobacteraceae bacterium]|nr:hypothetical protein [Desulfobacteraceae bacterium]